MLSASEIPIEQRRFEYAMRRYYIKGMPRPAFRLDPPGVYTLEVIEICRNLDIYLQRENWRGGRVSVPHWDVCMRRVLLFLATARMPRARR